jgi:hypothetical protein
LLLQKALLRLCPISLLRHWWLPLLLLLLLFLLLLLLLLLLLFLLLLLLLLLSLLLLLLLLSLLLLLLLFLLLLLLPLRLLLLLKGSGFLQYRAQLMQELLHPWEGPLLCLMKHFPRMERFMVDSCAAFARVLGTTRTS